MQQQYSDRVFGRCLV